MDRSVGSISRADSTIRLGFRFVDRSLNPYRRRIKVFPGHGREGLDHIVTVRRSRLVWRWVATCLLVNPSSDDEATSTEPGAVAVDHVHAQSEMFQRRRDAVKWALDHLDHAGPA